MEWKERAVHGFCFADRPKSCSRKAFSPLHEGTHCAAAHAEQGADRRGPGAGQLPFSSQALRDSLCSPLPDIPLPPSLAFTHSCPGSASLPCPSPTQQHNITTQSIFVALYSLVHPDQLLGNIPKLNSLSCIPRYEIKWADLLGYRSERHPIAPAFLQHQAESEPLTRQVLLLPALFICFSHVNIFKCSP